MSKASSGDEKRGHTRHSRGFAKFTWKVEVIDSCLRAPE